MSQDQLQEQLEGFKTMLETQSNDAKANKQMLESLYPSVRKLTALPRKIRFYQILILTCFFLAFSALLMLFAINTSSEFLKGYLSNLSAGVLGAVITFVMIEIWWNKVNTNIDHADDLITRFRDTYTRTRRLYELYDFLRAGITEATATLEELISTEDAAKKAEIIQRLKALLKELAANTKTHYAYANEIQNDFRDLADEVIKRPLFG